MTFLNHVSICLKIFLLCWLIVIMIIWRHRHWRIYYCNYRFILLNFYQPEFLDPCWERDHAHGAPDKNLTNFVPRFPEFSPECIIILKVKIRYETILDQYRYQRDYNHVIRAVIRIGSSKEEKGCSWYN